MSKKIKTKQSYMVEKLFQFEISCDWSKLYFLAVKNKKLQIKQGPNVDDILIKKLRKKTKINKIKSQRRRIWDKSQRKKCGFEPNPNAEEIVPQKARVFIENQVIQEAEDISRPNRFFKFGRSIFCFVHPIFRFCFLVTFFFRKYKNIT